MTVITDCREIAPFLPPYVESSLPGEQRAAIDGHLLGCPRCRKAAEDLRAIQGLLKGTLDPQALLPNFKEKTGERMRVTTGAVLAVQTLSEPVPIAHSDSWVERLGAAPWWAVSVVLHLLVIVLLGLITMSIGILENRNSIVVLTSLEKMASVKPQEETRKQKQELRDVLESKHETPATDANSTVQSNIVVPPEILAKAELGDHFETINLDRPDTQSAFGNPEARMFHSASGNDEPEGGGGLGGSSLMDDLIGAGGSVSPGTGGGWGGGNGTGTGVGNGAGHGSFGMRNGGGRKLMVMKHGGSKATESAVDKALEWLARNQEANGSWSIPKHGGLWTANGDVAVSGLGLLAFLGAGHTEKVGKYKETVTKAVDYLIKLQKPSGELGVNGDFYSGGGYNHAIAGLALAEAAAMGRIARTCEAAQKAITWSMDVARHKPADPSGSSGWRYRPGLHPDISITGWYVMQLKSAKVGGFKIDTAAFTGASAFLDTCMVKREVGDYGAELFVYKPDCDPRAPEDGAVMYGTSPWPSTTAIGTLCRLFLGAAPHSLKGSAAFLLKDPPKWPVASDCSMVCTSKVPDGVKGFYYWYYGTLALFQIGGEEWKQWNETLKCVLVTNQCKAGPEDGSWDPRDVSDWTGGRAYTTALGALCLEVYYRYLPLYR